MIKKLIVIILVVAFMLTTTVTAFANSDNQSITSEKAVTAAIDELLSSAPITYSEDSELWLFIYIEVYFEDSTNLTMCYLAPY